MLQIIHQNGEVISVSTSKVISGLLVYYKGRAIWKRCPEHSMVVGIPGVSMPSQGVPPFQHPSCSPTQNSISFALIIKLMTMEKTLISY
jgi:hypothetical protein